MFDRNIAKTAVAQPRAADVVPAVRFFGSHRYFRETGELVTEGVAEIRDTLGVRSGWFECRGRLRHVDGGSCGDEDCHCLVCTRPDPEDADDDSGPLCQCVRCAGVAPHFAHSPRAVRKLISRPIGRRRR